ncbi:MAG: hypothetical protein H0V00_19405 [Chloroflexia bacterium]|nr:hypothetical protein [Chloroflexia bacterium]
MNQDDDIDEARAALIDQRIGQTFDFLSDVIDDPKLLEAIPDGSKLAFRDITIRRYQFRLTASRPRDPAERWTARVTGYTKPGARHGTNAGAVENPMHPPHGIPLPEAQTGATAPAALDALEAELRGLVRIPA